MLVTMLMTMTVRMMVAVVVVGVMDSADEEDGHDKSSVVGMG